MFSFDDPQLRKVLTVVAAAGAAALTFVAPAGTGLSPTGVAVAQPGGGTDAPGVDNRLGGDVRDQIKEARAAYKAGLSELKEQRQVAKELGKDSANEVKQQIRDYKQEFKSEIRDIKRGP